MKLIYTFLLALTCCFLPGRLFAQDATTNAEVTEDFEDLESDSSHISCIDSAALMIANFDSTKVPCANIYKSWNHLFVNPYDTNQVKKPDTTHFDLSGYCHPRKNYLTSDFGFRRYRHHYGVDIKIQVGDTIYSSFDGMIRICKYSPSFGNYIVVRHNNGLETIYAHLSKPLVNINQVVKSGQPLGLGGNTGRSTGPHLHYEIRYLGQNINPHDIIDFNTYAIKTETFDLSAKNFAYLAAIQATKYHVVRRGETLGRIAMKHGVTVTKLCKLNKIKRNKCYA